MKKSHERTVAFLFGAVFITVMLGIVLTVPHPTPAQYLVFRIVLAIAVAGVAAMVPGFLEVNISSFIRAGGALAVFVIVYFYNPAALVVAPPNPVIVHSGQKISGAGASWSPWYSVCGEAPANATIKSVRFVLSGDRTSCGAWSECRESARSDSRVCHEFRLQGHSEWNAPGQATSEGTLEVAWEYRK